MAALNTYKPFNETCTTTIGGISRMPAPIPKYYYLAVLLVTKLAFKATEAFKSEKLSLTSRNQLLLFHKSSNETLVAKD